jgi:hypothetical protein
MAELQVTLTCPECGHRAAETMPLDRCVFFFECPGCHSVLKPRLGGLLRLLLERRQALSADPGRPPLSRLSLCVYEPLAK